GAGGASSPLQAPAAQRPLGPRVRAPHRGRVRASARGTPGTAARREAPPGPPSRVTCPAGAAGRPLATARPTRPCGGRVIIVMGGHHAISGAAAWLALTGSASLGGYRLGGGVLDLAGPEVLAGAVVADGWSMSGSKAAPAATTAPANTSDLR